MAVILGAEIYSCPSEAPFALKHSSEGGWVTLNPERPQALCSHQMTTESFHAAPGSLPSCSSGSSHSQKDRSQNRGGKNCVEGDVSPLPWPPDTASALWCPLWVTEPLTQATRPSVAQLLLGSQPHLPTPISPFLPPPITHPHLPPLTPPSPSLTSSLPHPYPLLPSLPLSLLPTPLIPSLTEK